MDLLEQRGSSEIRHPWELARLRVVEQLISPVVHSSARVLDIGCGDGFVLAALNDRFSFAQAAGVDVNLSAAECGRMTRGSIEFLSELPATTAPNFDLMLLLDVLEHVEQPVAFLAELVRDQLRAGGWALITVPAFQSLFSEHDKELRHFRRYRRSEAVIQAQQAGLQVVGSGYFFFSLLAARALTVLKERISSSKPRSDTAGRTPAAVGLGRWQGGRRVSEAVSRVLSVDARACLALERLGCRVPGLSAWLLCRR